MAAEQHFARHSQLASAVLIKAFESRNFEAHYCADSKAALELALSLIPQGTSVTWGGSETVRTIGLIDAVKAGNYEAVDRDEAKDVDGRIALMRRAFSCDWFLMSANAMTEDGQLVNIDGNGNRVAALTFGPKNVLVIAGMNKLCKTLDDAIARARNYAAPVNCLRVYAGKDAKTPCQYTGLCADCKSEQCICNTIAVTRRSSTKGRIKVILVGEPLGY